MPGFGFEDDELKKLFAEAGEAVKKAKVTPSEAPAPPPPPPAAAAPEPAAPSAPSAPEPVTETADESDFQVQPVARPAAPAPSGEGAVRLGGGEQTDAALVARTTAGSTVNIPWGQIKNLSLGRVVDRNILAFLYNGTVYYFNDENVAYKGLLRQMAATLTMNWRGLVNEIAAQVSDKSDPGIQAVTGAGGMVPKFLDLGAFLNGVRSR
jgi:hypothetical protein